MSYSMTYSMSYFLSISGTMGRDSIICDISNVPLPIVSIIDTMLICWILRPPADSLRPPADPLRPSVPPPSSDRGDITQESNREETMKA